MVKWIETTGRTEEDAISAALFQLGLDRDDVSVEVVERAKSGFLGFGGNPAKVRVSYEVSEEGGKPRPMKDEFKISVFDEPAPVKKEEPKAAPAPAPVMQEEKKAPKPERPQLEPGDEIIMAAPPKKEERKPVRSERPRQERAPRFERRNDRPQRESAPVHMPAADLPLAGAEDEKAQHITEFLNGLMEHLHVQAVPQVHVNEEGAYRVILEGQELGAIIGRRGETLDAIQQLTNYAVNHGQSKRVRIQIDAEGYRAKREESLQRLAVKVAGKVVKYRKNVTLEAMNAYERHVIHTALQDYPNVTTFSTGVEPNRRTVVAYAPGEKK